MSNSPYVYDNKSNKPVQGYSGLNAGNYVGASAPGLSNYAQQQQPAYNPYQQTRPQQQQQAAQQQQSPQQQQQPVAQSASSQQQRAPYYNQYDQQQQVYGSYGQPAVQQYQQQPNYYGAQPQPSGVNQAAYGVPQYNQSFVNSYNQGATAATGAPGYQPATSTTSATAAAYGYPNTYAGQQQAQFTPNDTNSPYKSNNQMVPTAAGAANSGANINMANIRGGLQSAAAPPLIDPNQVPQRPKLTTTFWEDENTVCYQVESRGISVSRREDTNFINGTKLLNVAGMTRGRRDGILKSEKVRYVVKIGAMNLKGVWIPFERALELARNEGIVDLLYPLFVRDIKELYQGPQYSGGLTAAANSNPKNIIPVQVTNTTYTPSAYATREKKLQQNSTPKDEEKSSQAKPQVTQSTTTTQPLATPNSTQPQSVPQQQLTSNIPYGYTGATYPYSNQYSYAQQPGVTADGTPAYAQAGYYGYQQAVPTSDGTSGLDGDHKKVDGEDKK